MFTIYQQIANRLKDKLSDLKTIDFDSGQLADPEKAYPLDFPAVLIDMEQIDWQDNSQKVQSGKATISVTVAVLPVNQSRQDSPTINSFIKQMGIINLVYTALKGYTGGETITIEAEPIGEEPAEPEVIQGVSFSPLTRIRTQRQKRYDRVQAFTHTFTCSFKDRTAQPVYTKPLATTEVVIELE
jgi:hypothetical protein